MIGIAKSRAAVLVATGSPLEILEIDLPRELKFGQVLVKVHYSGICGAQINEIDGVKGPDKYLPHLLGHEGSATVIQIGEGVTTVKPDDRVVMHWRQGAGIQANPAVYRHNGRLINSGWVTTFNDYAVVSENRVTKIPSLFDSRLAPLFGCAVSTAFGVVNNDAQVKIGQSLVVFGVGGVGLSTIQAARMVSAYPIIAIDVNESKLEMALQHGATHAVLSRDDQSVASEVQGILGELGSDVVIDTTGITSVIERAYSLTNENGKTILVGVPKLGQNVSLYTLPLHFKKILKGSHGGQSQPHEDIPRYVRLTNAGILNLSGLITHEYDLSDVNEALKMVRSGSAGRVLLKLNN